jgi:hypothetical protein
MISFALGFPASLLVTLSIVRYTHVYEEFSSVANPVGRQKFQSRPVPCVGEAGILHRSIFPALQVHHAYSVIKQGAVAQALRRSPKPLRPLVKT